MSNYASNFQKPKPNANVQVPQNFAPQDRLQPFYPNTRVCKADISSTGEAVQLVRPVSNEPSKPSKEIVDELLNKYDYRKNQYVRATENDLTAVERAFGSNLKNELLNSYDGSTIVSDNQQDLIGERYLEEQIRQMNQKKVSVVDRYAHLLYEGEKEHKPSQYNPSFYLSSANLSSRPVQQQEFVLSKNKVSPANKPN